MPTFRQMSETVSPLARSRSASRSNRATSSAVLRLLMGPSVSQSTRRLPFRLDQFLGSRPDRRNNRRLATFTCTLCVLQIWWLSPFTSPFVELDDLVRVVLDSLDQIGVGALLPFRSRHQHLLDSGFIISHHW